MRVRCVRHVDVRGEHAGEEVESRRRNPEIGSEHYVFAVRAESFQPRGLTALHFFMQVTPSSTPSWFPARMFEMASPAMPSHWLADLTERGELTFAPAPWLNGDFWRGMAGVGSQAQAIRANELFHQEVERMKEEDQS